jgi:tetratricopeptide (TPR) repeat protein
MKQTSVPNETFKHKNLDSEVDALQNHPFFLTEIPDEETVQSNKYLEAFQSLLYDDSPEEIAENFRKQGNECYLAGKAKYNDAIIYYTKGLEMKCSKDEINSKLCINRALVHLKLYNYRNAIEDCLEAIRIQPKCIKAHYRAACAYSNIDKFDLAIKHIDEAILLDSADNTLKLEKQKIIEKKITTEKKKQDEQIQKLEIERLNNRINLEIKVQ